MKRKICTQTQIYGQEQKVGRLLTRSVSAINCSSATSLYHDILFCLFSTVSYYLQLPAKALQISFSSSLSMTSVHISCFLIGLSQLPRLPGGDLHPLTFLLPSRVVPHASSLHVQTEDATWLKDIFPLYLNQSSLNWCPTFFKFCYK